jgi:hypothetical protein
MVLDRCRLYERPELLTALQRMIQRAMEDDRTIADLSLRKPAATNAGMLPMPGQVRLLLGNATNEERPSSSSTSRPSSWRLAPKAS